MLLLASLDAGRALIRESVDVSQLVVDAVSDAHAAGPEHRWRLDLPDEPVTVTGDPTRLAQVLANLLGNARVHTPPGTTVTADLTTVPGQVVLRVLDDGPGISPGLLPQVFSRFARGDSSRSRAAGSTGLGLAIAHAVIAAHGGTIAADSDLAAPRSPRVCRSGKDLQDRPVRCLNRRRTTARPHHLWRPTMISWSSRIADRASVVVIIATRRMEAGRAHREMRSGRCGSAGASASGWDCAFGVGPLASHDVGCRRRRPVGVG